MAYNPFFDFTAGLAKTMKVPVGTKADIVKHIKTVESTLKIERENNHWERNGYSTVSDEVLCEIAEEHNTWVIWFYNRLEAWAEKPPKPFEKMTKKDFKYYLPALVRVIVPPERWTRDYYRKRMEVLYEVMRSRECEGITFDEKALTTKQASQVINLFSEFLDVHDLRLAVPKDCDYLASLSEGEYEWCERCGAITYEHSLECRKHGCPLKKEHAEEER
ncbi:MAG: hypothetical protein PHS33_09030 [Candidatus Omnitrophica bacterium]|nr:hypothetical protein [Candidatus Omnitrophota bacterium]